MPVESLKLFHSIVRRCFRAPASDKTGVLAILFFIIIIHAPFLGQAFHMDDAIYLILARNVFSNPVFPQEIGVHVEGIWAGDLASMEHPPLTAYLIAAGAWLARGFHELPLHVLFLLFAVVLGFSTYSLSCRFTRHPLAATALLLSAPVVFIMSHTLMTDLPHLSLLMLAVALFTKGVDDADVPRTWSGAAAAALAIYISPAALCLVPLLACYALLKRRPGYLPAALLLPLVAQGLWWFVNYLHYGRFTPGFILHYYFATEKVLGLQALSLKALYALLATGGLTVSPAILFSSSYRKFLSLGLPLGMAAATITEARDYPVLLLAAFVLFFTLGLAAVAGCLSQVLKNCSLDPGRVTDVFLGIWLIGAMFFAILFHMTGSARYLLPLVPPLVLLTMRQLEAHMRSISLRILSGTAILTSSLISLGLGAADYRFAEVYRHFASYLNSVPDLRTRPIWFTGEWGFRAYLEHLGARELGRRDARPQPGDLLVVPSVAVPYSTLFSQNISHESIVMVAPSRACFEVPALNRPATLFFLIGMPGWQQSDGLDLLVQWDEHTLYSQRLLPESGRAWRPIEIQIPAAESLSNKLVLSVQVGASGNADADWVAITHARIRTFGERGELVHFALREQLPEAQISGVPGMNYHTPRNEPLFEMEVWLDQEPPIRILDVRRYTSSWPVRLIDAHVRAGFWSMGWGLLPFSFALNRDPIEEIRIFEVLRAVDSFDERNPSWYSR